MDDFDPNESRLSSAMAMGHKARMGHELTGHWVTDEEGVRHLVRTCCGGEDE